MDRESAEDRNGVDGPSWIAAPFHDNESEMKRSRLTLFRLVLALSLFARAAAPAIAAEDELPKRRPGLWRISTISPEVGLQTNDVCIEEGDSIIGAQDESCTKPSVTRANDQIIVTIECGPKDSREVVSLLFTGDFQNWYRAQSRMTAKGNRSGFTIDAKFLSERCARKRARSSRKRLRQTGSSPTRSCST